MATTMITVRYFTPSEYKNLTIHYNSCLKGSYRCICYILLVVVYIDEHDIDSIDGYEKTIPGLHLKPEGEPPECFCGDVYKMQVSRDYKTLWQRFWMCDNLAYDPKSGDMEVRTNRLCCTV
jgi:hypothetical protein